MDSFLSKASSFMSSQAEQEAPPPNKDGEHRKPASSGGYGDLLAGAQSLMHSATKPSAEESSHKSPTSTDKYGDVLAGAQALMGAAKPKPKDDGISMDEGTHKSSGSGGFGELLAGAQAISGSAKPSGDGAPSIHKEEDAHKSAGSGYGDLLASTQVLMKAAKVSGEADMGEVAGATANLVGAAAQYGNLEKSGYGEYASKAQGYLRDYQASHSKPAPGYGGSAHKSPSSNEGSEEDDKPSSKAPRKPAYDDDDQRE